MAKATVRPNAQSSARRTVTNCLLLAFSNCMDPSREQEFNDWYTNVHLRDVVSLGVYHTATRYVNTDWTPEQPKYLAVYETDWTDATEASRAVAERNKVAKAAGKGARHETIRLEGVYPFQKVRGPILADAKSAGKATNSVSLVLTNCADPSREAEFNEWYNKEHAPDVLSLGVYHTCNRYVNTTWQPGQPRFLALYETDWDDANQAGVVMRQRLEALRKAGKGARHPLLQMWSVGKLKPITNPVRAT